MWNAIKLLFANAQMRTVLSALIAWLKTEAASFVAAYLQQAIPIVIQVAKEDLPNDSKRTLACSLLKDELRTIGVAYKERYINQTIEKAWELAKPMVDKLDK